MKLELGLVYIEMEQFTKARSLFEEVLSKPPKSMGEYKNPAALDERDKTHRLKISLLTGVNSDSNANAAPSSGNVTVVDTTIPLGTSRF